jgi:beta-glucosidase
MSGHFISFPDDFLWGAATSSFQIEGSPLADGAASSNWYEWTHTPGRISGNQNADIACNHFHLYKDDIAMMKRMGLKAYRLSFSWPRIIPERGRVNEKGLDFYRRVLDELQKAGITPSVTLFHWEVPVWAKGEWENRETAIAFGEYAETVFKKLGREVPYWATHNETVCTSQLGYLWGYFPPGKSDKKAFSNVVHHLNLSHGLAVRAFHQSGLKGEIGWVLALAPIRPSTQDPVDIQYAKNMDALHNRVFLDPVAGRGYPSFLNEFAGTPEGPVAEDLKIISQPIDFLGVNHYFPNYARYAPGLNIFDNDFTMPDRSYITDMRWKVDAPALYELLTHLHKEYGHKKILITENGMAMRDSLRTREEMMEDNGRVYYLGHYLAQMNRAMKEGVPVKGYFAWSLMDNFEWGYGYDPRFGLIYVDFKTQERIFKKSAYWYQKAIADKGFDMESLPKDPPFRVFDANKKMARSFE